MTFFSQIGSNGSTPDSRLREVGYIVSTFQENIAASEPTPQAVVQSWLNDPGERANLFDPDVRGIGVGYCFLENDTGNFNAQHYWTLILANRTQNPTTAIAAPNIPSAIQGG